MRRLESNAFPALIEAIERREDAWVELRKTLEGGMSDILEETRPQRRPKM
jgi:hypothetical protein